MKRTIVAISMFIVTQVASAAWAKPHHPDRVHSVPELDPTAAAAALVLVGGGVAIIHGRRRRRA